MFLIIGCDSESNSFHEKAKKVICTKEQLKMVKAEFDICDKTGYLSTHCYDMARVNHCK